MSTSLFFAASALAAIWLCVHLILGGREIARPLLNAPDLDPVVRDTQYLCWHFTSVSIACMAGFFGTAAIATAPAFAVAGVALAGSFAVAGIGLVMLRGGNHARLPQGWLFVPVAAMGIAGLVL